MISRCLTRRGLPAGYFDKTTVTLASATSRVYWGNGTDYLDLDPYKTGSLASVTMPSGWTVPSYVELTGQTLRANDMQFGLVRTYGDNASRFSALTSNMITQEGANFNQFYVPEGWPDGIKVTVSAVGIRRRSDGRSWPVWSRDRCAPRYGPGIMRVVNLETNQVSNARPDTQGTDAGRRFQ